MLLLQVHTHSLTRTRVCVLGLVCTNKHTENRSCIKAPPSILSWLRGVFWESHGRRVWQPSSEIKTILSWFLPHSREKRKLSVSIITARLLFARTGPYMRVNDLSSLSSLSSAQRAMTVWYSTSGFYSRRGETQNAHRSVVSSSQALLWIIELIGVNVNGSFSYLSLRTFCLADNNLASFDVAYHLFSCMLDSSG